MLRQSSNRLQTSAIVDLAGDQITRPELGRLADTIRRKGQVHLQQLQGWLAARGLAPYDPQQDPNRRTDSDLSMPTSSSHARPGKPGKRL